MFRQQIKPFMKQSFDCVAKLASDAKELASHDFTKGDPREKDSFIEMQPGLTDEVGRLAEVEVMLLAAVPGDDPQLHQSILSFLDDEMIAERQPFRGETPADSLAAILQADPEPLASLRPDVPPALEQVVGRCLEKRQADRFESARDVAFALAAGMSAHDVFAGVFAKDIDPSSGGRQMPNHWSEPDLNIFTQSSVIGPQYTQACGIAYDLKRQGSDAVVVVEDTSEENLKAVRALWPS